MKSKIVQIGNSRGIRIPKALLEQAGLDDDVDIDVTDAGLVIRASTRPRAGWNRIFEKMAEYGDDKPLDDDTIIASEEEAEWEW